MATRVPTAESFSTLGKPAGIDREKGVITGVRVSGPVSANGGTYPADVYKRALRAYEGCPVNVDTGHHQKHAADIPVTAKFGKLVNPRVENDGLHADLQFNPKHPFADQFCWACEHNPTLYGFSHFAQVQWRNNADGSQTAEGIHSVLRVDIVSEPATTSGVFESKDNNMDLDPRAIASQITTPSALTDFLKAMFAALPSGSFDNAAKSAALDALVTEFGQTDTVPADDMAAAESVRRFGKVGRHVADLLTTRLTAEGKAKLIEQARGACKEHKLPDHLATDTFVELVAESMSNPARVKAMVEDRIATANPAPPAGDPANKTPKTSPPGTGGQQKTVKELVDGMAIGR